MYTKMAKTVYPLKLKTKYYELRSAILLDDYYRINAQLRKN